MRPIGDIRIYHFNIEGLYIPRMVVTDCLLELCFGNPMHPFFD